MAGLVGAIARSRRVGVLTCITTSCRTKRLSPYARLWLISTVKHPGGGCCAAAAVEHPRARSIRRATSPRPQGTRSPASIAKRDTSVRAARSVRARVLAALVLPWARAVQDDAPAPATRHDLAACLPGRYVAQRSVRLDAPARSVPRAFARVDRRGGARPPRCATRLARLCRLKSCPP